MNGLLARAAASGSLVAAAVWLAAPGPTLAQAPDPIPAAQVTGHVLQPQAVPPTDARLSAVEVPLGFALHRFADGLDNPRIMRTTANGTVYVTQRAPGNLVLLRDTNRDGIADVQKTVLEGIPHLHGIEIRGDRIYLTAIHRLWSAAILPDGSIGKLDTLLDDLPDAGQHPNRTLRFGPDGALYLSVGSTCNACREPNPEHAALLRIDASNERRIFADGLRNTIGFGWHPVGRLYGMDHNVDWLGDEISVEELNEIVENGRYGWPFVYFDGEAQQPMPYPEPYFVSQELWQQSTRAPALGYDAHAAPMEMHFYKGDLFPDDYRNDALVAMHGSWNRAPAVGYEIVRIRFDASGEPESIEPFVSNFLVPSAEGAPPGTPGFIARPVGLAELPDGSLLVSDDSNNQILRIVYGNTKGKPAPQQLASEIFADEPATIELRSSAFRDRGEIDIQYTAYGAGRSPPLSWSQLPEGTQSVVLMMEDPQATSPLPFVHWLITDIAPEVTGLATGLATTDWLPELPKARQGSNSRSTIGYFGPRPPPGDEAHPYHFQVFALDRRLELTSGFNRKALLDAMAGHVLARGELVGTFAMPLPERGIGPEAEEESALLDVPGWDRKGTEPAL